MAGSENLVILIGRLGADPEIRSTQGGSSVANLRIATTDSWNDKRTGERASKTEWHTVILFGNQADVARQYLKKGANVYIRGSLKYNEWEDQNGTKRRDAQVVAQSMSMLDSRPQNGQASEVQAYAARQGEGQRSVSQPAQRAQNQVQTPARKNFPGRVAHETSFDIEDSVPWLDEA